MIGSGISRTDGPLKVTGRARYSAERQELGPTLHAYVLGAGIGLGRIERLDTAKAEAAPGVRLVLTHRNAPAQAPALEHADMFDAQPQLWSDRIDRYGMPIALVVADSFEEARAAAAIIEVDYVADPDAAYEMGTEQPAEPWHEASRHGDLDAGLRQSAATIDVTYSTPYHFGHPMELNAAIADWREGHLTLFLTAQMIAPLRDALAETLLLHPDAITIDSAFIGGGFGSKIALHAEAVLTSLAAMQLGRPVKLILTRRQLFTLIGHRAATVSRIRLGATADGKLHAIGHDARVQTSPWGNWSEGVATVARPLYPAPHRLTRTAHRELDLGAAEPVRGPGELSGLMVLESAIDELAHKLDIDPVEFRLRNDTNLDPEKKVPLSSRRLGECLTEGAERFGWDQRPKQPASRRDGRWLIGYGVASSMRGHFQTKTDVIVRLEPDGTVIVRSDMTDLGTGTYTIAAQVAATALGVGVEQVKVELARTNFPRSEGSGGSWGSGNTSVAVDRACQILRGKITEVAGTGFNDLFAEVRRHFPDGLEATGHTRGQKQEPDYTDYSIFTYGASFAEVAVDIDTAEVRLRRMLGVFSAGRILNPKTARSQLIGGMIWGVSAALHEGAYADPRHGHWVNGDLAEYLMPTHADLPDIEAVMLDDFDERANHLGVKGIGELGAGGTGGSVANAVFNATGVRVRDFPIRIDRLLSGLPKD
ncbi:molybdopterin cofactor-binding domain-containing protein [Devosia sp. CN2-171]|uniref:molybdopterin cofactor-binding domain-containing protein n=1 Tax=Devosia sp. CN2-171 TaxID=3400909 RepID=UPI003BF8EDC6